MWYLKLCVAAEPVILHNEPMILHFQQQLAYEKKQT